VSPLPPAFNSKPVCIRTRSCYSLPTIDYSLSPSFCFHALTNPSFTLIDLQVLHFHTLTNPFSRNPFSFTSIQNPRGVGGCVSFSTLRRCLPRPGRGASALKNCLTPFLTYSYGLLESLCPLFQARVLCFQSLADSFCKTPGVWGVGPAGKTCVEKKGYFRKLNSVGKLSTRPEAARID
jgi:hypothetical protein